PPRAASLRRPASAPSSAASKSAALPRRTASLTRSNPATARPARRASPSASQHRFASKPSMRSASPAGATTGRRAARAKSRFATARSTISRRAVNHKPRPGRRAATSGTIAPSGPTTKRSKLPRSRTSPVTMQRRSAGESSAGVAAIAGMSFGAPAVGLLLLRRGGSRVLFCRGGVGLLEPVGAGGHDHRVGIVEFEPGAALVGAGEHLDQFVAGEIGEIVERLDAVLAERHQYAGG